MYEVRVTKIGTGFTFRAGFFPRRARYKADAKRLVAEVKRNGGEAIIVKIK